MTEVNIMVVEDEVIIAKEIKIKLENVGYSVTSIVNSGERAIESSDQDRPDLILMDINLKGKMDGIEAAEIIHSRFGIPIIFLTAYADEDKLERAKITMPFGYILKPFTDSDLKVNIEMARYVAQIDAERRHAEEELRNYRDHLEELVEERNAQILKSNEQLQKEMEERKQAEEERRESQLQLFQSSKLVSLGEIDFVNDDLDGHFGVFADTLVKHSEGVDIKSVFFIDASYGGDVIVAKKEIQTIDDLKGKKISVIGINPNIA